MARAGPNLTLPVLFRIADHLDDLLLPYTIDLTIYADISDPDLIKGEESRKLGSFRDSQEPA